MPQPGDFEQGRQVLVFPTCRFGVEELQISDTQISWSDPVVLEADLQSKGSDEDPDSPHPSYREIDFDTRYPADIPTIWFQPPLTRPADRGLLRLRDGQQFSLGKPDAWTLGPMEAAGIQLQRNDRTEVIPWNRIESVQLPQAGN